MLGLKAVVAMCASVLTCVVLVVPQTAQADEDFLRATLICLETGNRPKAREATFARYGYSISEDAYLEPDMDLARKDELFVTFSFKDPSCLLSKRTLTHRDVVTILRRNVGRYYPIVIDNLSQCPSVMGFDVNGVWMDVFVVNASTYAVTCRPGDLVEVRIREFSEN